MCIRDRHRFGCNKIHFRQTNDKCIPLTPILIINRRRIGKLCLLYTSIGSDQQFFTFQHESHTLHPCMYQCLIRPVESISDRKFLENIMWLIKHHPAQPVGDVYKRQTNDRQKEFPAAESIPLSSWLPFLPMSGTYPANNSIRSHHYNSLCSS